MMFNKISCLSSVIIPDFLDSSLYFYYKFLRFFSKIKNRELVIEWSNIFKAAYKKIKKFLFIKALSE